MKKQPIRYKLESAEPAGSMRFLAGLHVSLEEGKKSSIITIIRTGSFNHPAYGRFKVTRELLDGMVRNFESKTYGQDIFMDVGHEPQKGAAGEITRLFVEGNRLRAVVEWTAYGIEAIEQRGFRYISAEYIEDWEDNEEGKKHGPLLFGAALVTRPHIKRMDPVRLAEAGNIPTLVHPELSAYLLNEAQNIMKEFLKKLRAALEAKKLSEKAIVAILKAAENSAKALAEDEEALQSLHTQLVEAADEIATSLAEGHTGDLTITLQAATGGKQLTEADIDALFEKRENKRLADAAALAAKKTANVKIFTDAIGGQEGFSDELKKQLSENVTDLITADMTEGQIKALADNQIAMGNQLTAQQQLAGMGFQGGPAGSVRVTHVTSGDSKALQEQINEGLRRTSHSANGRLRLSEQPSGFVGMVLAEFDRMHAPQIHREVKMLSGGETGTSDTNLPVGFQRTVIMEALSDLRVLELVQTLTDFAATGTTQIPYETRDISDVQNDGIVYEGQPIHRASVSQAMDLAYILPMKLAFLISNEVMHFTRASAINWDAYARNVESNARVMRELIVRRICNELQRAADAYNAAAVTAEAFDAQLTGSNSIIKTVNFPIVRPHQQRDLQGNAVGSVENAITMTLNGTAITAYDGTGTQSAGTYFRVTNYNLGYIQLVDEAGTPVTPADTGTNTLAYSRATNILKVDSDLGSATLEQRMNDILRGIGSRKAMMSADRYVLPDFSLMSPVLNDMATNAEQFAASAKRNGTDTTASGDLETIKSIPAYSTNAPGVDLGDERILLGQRGTLSYTVAKPFVTGSPFEAVDSNGRAIGKKQAYGEEYSAIKVPTPIRDRLTSVIVYSVTGR